MVFQVDLRPYLPPVGDQGIRGTCLAFAATAAHEFERGTTSCSLDLSEEAIYWAASKLCGFGNGLTFKATADALDTQGQPEQALWPYDPFRNESAADYAPPPNALDAVSCFQGTMHAVTVSLDEVRSCLDKGNIVVAGVRMSQSFGNGKGGFVPMPAPHELLPIGHAIAIVGYANPVDPIHHGYFVFRNSWGDKWGDQGYGYLPYDYLESHCATAYVVNAKVN